MQDLERLPPSMKREREGEMSGCSFVRWTLLLCHEEEAAAAQTGKRCIAILTSHFVPPLYLQRSLSGLFVSTKTLSPVRMRNPLPPSLRSSDTVTQQAAGHPTDCRRRSGGTLSHFSVWSNVYLQSSVVCALRGHSSIPTCTCMLGKKFGAHAFTTCTYRIRLNVMIAV